MSHIPRDLLGQQAYEFGYDDALEGKPKEIGIIPEYAYIYEYGYDRGKRTLDKLLEINKNDPSREYISLKAAESMKWREREI